MIPTFSGIVEEYCGTMEGMEWIGRKGLDWKNNVVEWKYDVLEWKDWIGVEGS